MIKEFNEFQNRSGDWEFEWLKNKPRIFKRLLILEFLRNTKRIDGSNADRIFFGKLHQEWIAWVIGDEVNDGTGKASEAG